MASSGLLFNDMTLTRYRGVDVTPHTFNNLLKTIAQRSTSNTSTTKTKFEERIRDIILKFNPALERSSADMSTEYLLINSLRMGDKKEVTHNYNYNYSRWDTEPGDDTHNGDVDDDDNNYIDDLKELSEEDWDSEGIFNLLRDVCGSRSKPYVKKIKKKYDRYMTSFSNTEDESTNVKNILGIRRYNREKHNAFLRQCRTVLEQNTNMDSADSLDKYIMSMAELSQVIKALDGAKTDLQNDNEVLRNNLSSTQRELEATKTTVKEYESTVKEYETKLMSLQDYIKTIDNDMREKCNTIQTNSRDMAKMGAKLGEQSEELEKLRSDYFELQSFSEQMKNRITVLEQSLQNAHKENNDLINKNVRLETELNELKREMQSQQTKIDSYDCVLKNRDKDNEDKDKERLALRYQCEELQDKLEETENDKHKLMKEIHEANMFAKEMDDRHRTCDAKISELEQIIHHKNTELELMRSRLQDADSKIKKEIEENQYVLRDYMETCKTKQIEIDEIKNKNQQLLETYKDAEEKLLEKDRVIKEQGRTYTILQKKLTQQEEDYKKMYKEHEDLLVNENNKNVKLKECLKSTRLENDSLKKELESITNTLKELKSKHDLKLKAVKEEITKNLTIEFAKEKEKLEKKLKRPLNDDKVSTSISFIKKTRVKSVPPTDKVKPVSPTEKNQTK
ncbi:desmoplakin [Plodia interpunctella granulovirus]|uniref:Desmoplakin n=1 Tax=Plodia interpunctella granulovirus TaxID=262175 RepID=A0A1L5JGR8_9BBAC|nr:desmoplakin [Plodia interpunctella granulovirus]APO13981.1 desmoplakin [Plodia interpunctella granulovirus]